MFPDFNIYSTPLLILVIQGLILAGLLLWRYRRDGQDSDLCMALILIVLAYARTTYTVGFMGWYDSFQNTKINYYLLSTTLLTAPLIYLFVRTSVQKPFRLVKRDWWHFLPFAIYFLYKLTLLLHDMQQDDWDTGYSGEWKREFDEPIVSPLYIALSHSYYLVYLALTVRMFWAYRQKVRQFFSNTYSVELNWLSFFLVVYIALFAVSHVFDVVDSFVKDLNYKNFWWVNLFTAIAIVLLGTKALLTDVSALNKIRFDLPNDPLVDRPKIDQSWQAEHQKISEYLSSSQCYLDPELNLSSLAAGMRMSIHDTSAAINGAFGKNFNELINQYRVEAIQQKLIDPQYEHLSLVAIALDNGFNSKSTFNRVFKQISGVSPSEYRKSHKS